MAERAAPLPEIVWASELRARALLRECLSPAAWELYERRGRVWVQGRQRSPLRAGWVYEVHSQGVLGWCVNVREPERYPPSDRVLALKLWIEGDEDGFLRTAVPTGSLERAFALGHFRRDDLGGAAAPGGGSE